MQPPRVPYSAKVLSNMFNLTNPTADCHDMACPNTKFLGGELVFGPSSAGADEVDNPLFAGHESSYFEHTDPDSLFSEVMKAHTAVGIDAVGLNTALSAISPNVIHGSSSPRPKQRPASRPDTSTSTSTSTKNPLRTSDRELSYAAISCANEATLYGLPVPWPVISFNASNMPTKRNNHSHSRQDLFSIRS